MFRVFFHLTNDTYQLKEYPQGRMMWGLADIGGSTDQSCDTLEEAQDLIRRARMLHCFPPHGWEMKKNHGDHFFGVYIEGGGQRVRI